MKRIFAGLSLACLALAIPFHSLESSNDGSQVQLQFTAEDLAKHPGFDLDLNALRLVQLEGRDPVWMTELEKVGFGCSRVATPKLTWDRSKPRLRV